MWQPLIKRRQQRHKHLTVLAVSCFLSKHKLWRIYKIQDTSEDRAISGTLQAKNCCNYQTANQVVREASANNHHFLA